jgi:hypothetical protein
MSAADARSPFGDVASPGCVGPVAGPPRGNKKTLEHGGFAAEARGPQKEDCSPRADGPRKDDRDQTR